MTLMPSYQNIINLWAHNLCLPLEHSYDKEALTQFYGLSHGCFAKRVALLAAADDSHVWWNTVSN